MDSSRILDVALLFACSSWLLTHRTLLNRGFVLRRRGLSTDTVASLLIGITSSIWCAATLWHVICLARHRPPPSWYSERTVELVAQLARGPLLAQVVFCFWIVSWIDGLRAEKNRNAKPRFWSLAGLNGPFDWVSGLHRGFYWALVAAMVIDVIVPSIAALAVGDALVGIRNLMSILLFLLEGTASNPYIDAAHRYADSGLRIALPTSHHEGTLYVLPSTGVGFDAVWSPKVANEHLEADGEIMTLFWHMRSGRWL